MYVRISNINWTFLYKRFINHLFFQNVVPIFLNLLPAPLYTFAITLAASLSLYQKKFVVACPAIVVQEA